jgi:hypothetical protein
MIGTRTCQKCNAPMEPGVLEDMTGSLGPAPMGWQREGEYEALEMVVYRCDRCGLLEFYAPDPEEG